MDNNNVRNILPFGSTLRTFIARSTLTENDFRTFLNHKGIFFNSYDRKTVLPVFETILILPSDFKFLVGKQTKRDERIKRLSKSFALKKDFNLTEILPFFKFDSVENEINKNYQFITRPEPTEENGSYSFEYRIKSFDKYEAWCQKETEHNGAIIISKNENQLSIETTAEYTSPITKQINEDIISSLRAFLIREDILSSDVKAEFIKYEDFKDNEERIKFLLSFKNIEKNGLKINDIGDSKFGADSSQSLSGSDLEWMENRVKKTILSGKEIDKTPFFEDENQKYITVEEIVLKYEFNALDSQGYLKLKIGFPEILNRLLPDTPFEFSIINIKFNDPKMNGNEKRIEKLYSKIFHEEKDKLYKSLITVRSDQESN